MTWTRRAPLENGGRVGERARVGRERDPIERSAAELVALVRGGDRAAFATLYQRFARVVHAVALARVRPADAADVVQDVFLVAYERLDELREAAAFPGWLLQIARNRATDRAREPRPVEPAADPIADPVPSAEAHEALAAIRALPEAYRETLIMRLVEGLTGPEIAERTGLSPGSVRVNLHRGMMILRERLGVASTSTEGGDG
ncbi:MAG TPA: sigma-70 family RNA polymerase sigma factor [Kofleriaceae bacterium]|nr:sigma-70 family RNA polymerase sigma factor [Kofleriaceae bacterium]